VFKSEATHSADPIQEWLRGRGQPVAVYGTSGTVKCIANVITGMKTGGATPHHSPLIPFTRADLVHFLQALEGSTRKQRLDLALMKRKRVDLIIPGAILLLEFMNLFQVELMCASETGLREGLVAAFLQPVTHLNAGQEPCLGGVAEEAFCCPKSVEDVLDGHVPVAGPTAARVDDQSVSSAAADREPFWPPHMCDKFDV
jgi:exopolyphosphatase/pppGpp-phosphohydrolase